MKRTKREAVRRKAGKSIDRGTIRDARLVIGTGFIGLLGAAFLQQTGRKLQNRPSLGTLDVLLAMAESATDVIEAVRAGVSGVR